MSSLLPFISCQLNPFLKPTLCAIPISHPHAYILHEPSKTSSNHFYILSIKKPGFCCFTPSSFPIQVKLAEERKEREVVDSTKLVALKQNLEKHGIHCGDTSTLKRGEYNRLMCPKLVSLNNLVGVCDSYPSRWRESFRPWKRDNLQKLCARTNYASIVAACALSSELDLRVSTDSVEGVSIASTTSSESGEIKISVNVAGAKSQAIFDNVFSKMVAAAQPIPGFRREKGGKTPNIPKGVLLQILGPSKVYKQVIKKLINSTIADYVEKENLKVTNDLRVEQSFEELEETFEPGADFSFDAVLILQQVV